MIGDLVDHEAVQGTAAELRARGKLDAIICAAGSSTDGRSAIPNAVPSPSLPKKQRGRKHADFQSVALPIAPPTEFGLVDHPFRAKAISEIPRQGTVIGFKRNR